MQRSWPLINHLQPRSISSTYRRSTFPYFNAIYHLLSTPALTLLDLLCKPFVPCAISSLRCTISREKETTKHLQRFRLQLLCIKLLRAQWRRGKWWNISQISSASLLWRVQSQKGLCEDSLSISLSPPTLQCKGKELLSSTQCTVRGEIEERREKAENQQGLYKNSKLQLLYIKLLLRSQRNDVVESGGVFDGGFDLSAATRRGLIGHLAGKSCRNGRRGHGSIWWLHLPLSPHTMAK